ncbi:MULTISPECIES: DNA gyrase inhibitor YacG [Mesorhizobium]|uniref:DNA gyrase inhibitor YacG n=1 Tax=Mesorhizobium denitrificans TaxID=2294114 RepID=A0A371XD70_9HYPH|nr:MULTISPECIES: DNA gyrase inhibitor YacG [Mesorhizobium]RFC67188.1 DNA gyrase inhibitor YacG [Mesorhizobium denitrificans]
MTDDNSKVTPIRARRACPECGKPSSRENYPFCSSRCKDLDLNRWLSGSYVIGSKGDADEEGTGEN